jgi:hypothetical protein
MKKFNYIYIYKTTFQIFHYFIDQFINIIRNPILIQSI